MARTRGGVPTGDNGIALSAAQAAWFWSHALIGDMEGCWPWIGPGTQLPSRHWQVWINGRKLLVHRVAFVLAGGDLSDGLLVRHRCPGDPRPDCCNPRHLAAGTALDNARDRDKAGRRSPFLPRGQDHWSAKLTQADADRIREARRLGLRAEQIATIFGVSRATVYAIWAQQRYRRASDNVSATPAPGSLLRAPAPALIAGDAPEAVNAGRGTAAG